MSKYFLFAVFMFSFFYSYAQTVTIPSNSVVVVKTVEEINGSKLKVGQEIIMAVLMDVVIDDKVVIKAGAPVLCMVADASGSGMVGSSGDLTINFQSTSSVDGKNVNLTGEIRAKGESSTGSSIALSAILCPLFLLQSGDDAVIPAGKQSRALTLGDVKVNVKN